MSFMQKDNNISTNYRKLGNQCFVEKKYYEAMLFFNQSLCYAEKDSLNEALVYAARSKVYYEIGEYEKCYSNSQLSKAYKSNGNEKLDDREKECVIKVAQSTSSQSQEFFKLSHEPNEKIPFLVSCLQIHEDKKYGRHVVTEKELKVGDIIALEPNFAACQKLPEKHLRCYNCFKSDMMNLTACPHCTEVMFCSEKCQDELQVLHHFEGEIRDKYKDEFMFFLRIFNKAFKACNNSVEELKLFIESHPGKFSVFDFDLSNQDNPSYNKNRILAFKSMAPEVTNPAAMDTVWNAFFDKYKENFAEAWNVGEHLDFAQNIMNEFFLIFSSNTHLMSWYSTPVGFKRLYGDTPQRNSYATGAFPFMSLISHSCAPNCDTIAVKGDTLMLYVTQPIKKGQQIFISYGKSFTVTPFQERKEALKREYGFDCTCLACVNQYPVQLEKKHRKFKLPNRSFLDSIGAARDEFKRNNEYIQKYYEANFPCIEIDDLTERNVYNIACIASDCMRFNAV